jgi:hypothetical protein
MVATAKETEKTIKKRSKFWVMISGFVASKPMFCTNKKNESQYQRGAAHPLR